MNFVTSSWPLSAVLSNFDPFSFVHDFGEYGSCDRMSAWFSYDLGYIYL